MAQTTIQKLAAVRFGSGILEVGDDFASLVNVGAIREAVANFKGETVEIEFDNTDPIKKFKNGDKVSLTFNLAETDFETIGKLEDGYLTVVDILGTPVAGAVQVALSGTWLEKEFLEITNQNGDGSVITINSVTGSVDGALVADDDYELIKNGQGKYGIVLNLAGTLLTTEVQDITIDYDYTPNASKKLTSNDSGLKIGKAVRFTNTNTAGKIYKVDLTDASNIIPITMPFLADDADDVMTISFEMEGILVEIIDEQSVV